MANPASGHADVAVAEHAHAPIDSREYIRIAVVLAVVTAIEVGASFLTTLGVPQFIEILVLMILGFIKGALVVMFFMHLKFDSRWFSALFLSGTAIAVVMMILLLVLFGYKGGLTTLG